ncbi:MAG: lysine--tRNA ligase [Acholeplasmataceae bacterium]|jgi:lysyl-tRNA synthetase class 2
MATLTDQEIVRRNKVKELEKLGVLPFGHRYDVTTHSDEIFRAFGDKTKEELIDLNINIRIAGRIVLKRGQGRAGFMHLQDRTGRIQIYVRTDSITELEAAVWKQSDLGDIIGVEGFLFRTNTGELTVHVTQYTHLTKALKPLPEKYHGLQDIEETRRKRYLDLITNEEARRVAYLRPKIIRAFQHFFDSRGFVEVETPVLQSILGGAAARPFVTHHNALDMEFYLRIATEIPLKKLIVGGMEAVYEIGRLFRNEGMDSTHNPEFTTVEAYLAYADMEVMMDLIEDCLQSVAQEALGSTTFTFDEHEISFEKPFKRISMVEAIKEKSGYDFSQEMSLEEATKLAKKHGITVEKHFTVGHIIAEFFDLFVEPTIVQPTFVYGYPIEISPLAKKYVNNPNFTERFELFILGAEFANAYSELNDPIDQKERFEAQLLEREKGNDEANEMDDDFIEALEYGLPPTGGLGIGIDRLVMLLTNTKSIRDVILFPHLRQKPKK